MLNIQLGRAQLEDASQSSSAMGAPARSELAFAIWQMDSIVGTVCYNTADCVSRGGGKENEQQKQQQQSKI